MAYQVLFEMMRKGRVKLDFATRLEFGRSYRAGVRKGLFKIMSKMGISTIAQLSQLAVVRDRRPVGRNREHVLHGHRQPDAGLGLRRPGSRT